MGFGLSVGLIASISVSISMLIILCIGFTWTFMMEKFPNFAHTSYASLGTMTSFYLVRFYGLNPYLTMPISAIVGGLLGVILYLGIVRLIKKEGFREITLTFTFYILSQMIASVLALFSYWLLIYNRILSRGFMLRHFDFRWNGYPGIAIAAPIIMIFLVVVFHLFLHVTKFGISMRATAEDEELAASLGVNTKFVHIFSWFISGALAALAGAIMPLWTSTSIDYNDKLLVNVMAGSVLGGLTSIYGAIIGGLFVAISQKLLSYLLILTFGVHMGAYEALLPIIILFLVLAIEPNGITGFREKEITLHHIKTGLMNFFKTMKNMFNLEW
jgi:branched-chain amino acid transport system permease protein